MRGVWVPGRGAGGAGKGVGIKILSLFFNKKRQTLSFFLTYYLGHYIMSAILLPENQIMSDMGECCMETYMTPERKTYIEKLEKQKDAIDRILKMNAGTVVNAELRKQLRSLRDEAAVVLKKLRNDEFEIAIVGMEKAGKSTFANALIESDLLPNWGSRCTFTSTQIEYSGDGRDDSAVVSFYTQDTFIRDFRDKLRTLGFPNPERYSFDTLGKHDYETIYRTEVSEEKRKIHGNGINKDILAIIENVDSYFDLLDKPDRTFGAEDVQSGKLTEYITDEVKARAVRQVVIRSRQLNKMKNAVIFDVPGFNSPTELHKVQTRERMKAADAIVVVANGSKPSLTDESLSILAESDDEGNPLKDKLFVYANRVEDVPSISELEKNIRDTYAEWIDPGFLAPENRNRIIFGSALAYLQGKGLKEGDNALTLLNKCRDYLPCGDGIDNIRAALENYNRTERFTVLKRRVNRINADILNAFTEIRGDYSGEAAGRGGDSEYTRIVAGFCREMPMRAEEGLLKLKSKISASMQQDHPLSRQITEYITETVTTEKYSISDEMVEAAKLRTPYVDNTPNVTRIEGNLREDKFDEMYNDFFNNVINIADKHHAGYFVEIVDTVLWAMDVDKRSPYYDDLRTQLQSSLAPYRGGIVSSDENMGIYYQSLIERFSRDIYEVLITSQYSADRLEKFYSAISNFFSMSVFYRKPGSTDELSYMTVAPQNQPMCMMLLFHHYLDMAEKVPRLLDNLCRIAGVQELPDEIKDYAGKAIAAMGGHMEEILEQVRKAMDRAADNSGDFRLNLLRRTLYSLTEREEPCNIADRAAFEEYYGQYHNQLRKTEGYDIAYVRREFDKDIDTLRDVLVNGFVRAVSMEKPFVARETKSIDDIISYIKGEEFTDAFLPDNFWKIRYKETAQLDKKHRERQQNADIMREIDIILNTLSN